MRTILAAVIAALCLLTLAATADGHRPYKIHEVAGGLRYNHVDGRCGLGLLWFCDSPTIRVSILYDFDGDGGPTYGPHHYEMRATFDEHRTNLRRRHCRERLIVSGHVRRGDVLRSVSRACS